MKNTQGLRISVFLLLAVIAQPFVPIRRVCAADINTQMHKSMQLYEKGEYDKALKSFIKVLKIDPNNATAREYMLRCSQKIVEAKLGGPTSAEVEKEIAVEKQLTDMGTDMPKEPPYMDPGILDKTPAEANAEAALAAIPEPAHVPAPAPPPAEVPASVAASVPLAELPGLETPKDKVEPPAPAPTPEPVLPAEPLTAKPLIKQRDTLTNELRRRAVGRENIVLITETRGEIEIVFFLNRLFLPFSDTLRPDAYVVLDHVVSLLKNEPERHVILKAVDNANAGAALNQADLSERRCTQIFSYVLYASYRNDLEENDPSSKTTRVLAPRSPKKGS